MKKLISTDCGLLICISRNISWCRCKWINKVRI